MKIYKRAFARKRMKAYLTVKTYRYFFAGLIFFVSAFSSVSAQSVFEYKGYLQNMQSVWAQKHSGETWISGGITNRFDFALYPNDNFTVNLGLRNLLDYGNIVRLTPGYSDFVSRDDGWIDLTKKWSDGNSYVFYSSIDRLNIFYSSDNVELQAGRQRINWGVNLVWTPNDIFNSSSYLNFDYVEKPGSDALRAQYYLGISSSLQFVYKLDAEKKVSAAAMFKFNEWDYDFQLFAGQMKDDIVFGGGWSGNLYDANFSGEITYFRDKDNFSDSVGVLVSSLGGTYSFENGFYLHGEFLFNSGGTTGKAGGILNLFTQPYDAKNLSPAKYSLFGELSYPVTPLIRADVSAIFNPSDKSFYVGPFVDISLSQSVYLLLAGQFFSGSEGTEWGDFGEFYFLRVKWSF
ncbi:MAG: hypothetical protein GXO87_07375 [Chlorobi bacterium]|nr:hypothetical protein [Chlorobiota bacterium]